ncbi:MAG: nuclear transport factor 2 family protein [Gammaproteobacteria bacterium]
MALLVVGGAGLAAAHEGEGQKPAGAASSDPNTRAVVGTLENYARAITSNDLSQIKPLFVPGDNFSYFEGTFVNIGWQSYSEHMAPEMKLFDKPSYRLTDIRPFVSGDLAYATFAWAMDVTVVSDKVEGGRHPVSMNGMGTAVLSRVDGQWKIRHLHTARAPAKRDGGGSH